jgi:hypothetical protein
MELPFSMHPAADNSSNRQCRHPVLFPVITVLCGLAIPLVIAEIGLRLLPVSTATGWMSVNRDNPIVRFTPNKQFTFSKGWQFTIVNRGWINNYGFVNDQDYATDNEPGPVVLIGDSYIEARIVPYEQTVQGRMAKQLKGRTHVYSMGVSGAQLAQYLAFAQYAWNEFQPRALVFVIVGNDFDESLMKYGEEPGLHQFQEDQDNHDLRLVRTDYQPSYTTRLFSHSAVARYFWKTVGIGHVSEAISRTLGNEVQYVGNTAAYASDDRITDSRRVVDRFLSELPRCVRLDKSRILFVVDAMRPHIYADSDLGRAKGSYFDLMRQYFLEQAKEHGYEAIDMQPIFIARHRRDGSRFEFAIDGHWNALGHQEAADAIASSAVLQAVTAH